MKAEILDIEAVLSCVTAELSMPAPDLQKALANLDEARNRLLDLATGLEAPRNN